MGLGPIQFLPLHLDETQREAQELIFGHPVEEVATHWIPIHHFLLRLADEALTLLNQSGPSTG